MNIVTKYQSKYLFQIVIIEWFICVKLFKFKGIKDLNINHDTPVIFCVLTDNTLEQAQDRSGGRHGNKGVEAAIAAIKMAALSK